jgi:hypothetical protein
VRAKLQNIPIGDFSEEIIRKIVRGDKNFASAFHGHSLLEDVYGSDVIEGTFRYSSTNPISAELINPNFTGLIKLQLKDTISINPDTYRLGTSVDELSFQSKLSVENDTYSGRLVTSSKVLYGTSRFVFCRT